MSMFESITFKIMCANIKSILVYRTISGLVSTRFKKTPPTSSYLIAFIVSDFAYKERWSQVGFRHRVLAKPNEIESATFAVNESEKILNGIGDYLQVNYTLPKMDSAAIPNFGPGGKTSFNIFDYFKFSIKKRFLYASHLQYDIHYFGWVRE